LSAPQLFPEAEEEDDDDDEDEEEADEEYGGAAADEGELQDEVAEEGSAAG
jgi:hypothetical protein